MDGFKNTTKTSYDTSSGRKFANGGMTVSRADMPGGEGPMSKPAMVAKYAKGGSVKKAPSGTAPASGTSLHASGSLDLKGTVNVDQAATLSATAADLLLAAGDALCLDVTGTTTAARGCVTVTMVPV